MKRLYYRHADHSFWAEAPPDAYTVIEGYALTVVAAALDRGDVPRLESGAWKVYSQKDPPVDVVMRAIRQERDLLLTQSDWTQAIDVELTVLKKKAWADYRRALRRVPQQFPTGRNVVWPTKPE